MNIKYNKKKQELQDDPVMDGLLKTKEFVSKNSNTVTGFIVVLLVVLGLGFGYNQFRLKKIENAREDFGKAMVAYSEKDIEGAIGQFTSVAQKYRGSVSGSMAAYMLANLLFEQGRYDDAIESYKSVLSGPNVGFISAQANEGIAACFEAKGDVTTAMSYLQNAINDDRVAYRYSALRWKLALLAKNSDTTKAIKLCDEIIADTLAQDYRQEARYLRAMLAQ